ncbi:helix-turn-helix protein [Stackebrandtia endophytica]|uniref:Helix-turn-helix protein n=1 Tax=Stackebrandtia endophytica TaxID=1496996 RepID=A0A543B086_9ACTN|nr:helix-turn-helix transcriptional regulator [Stackebrandtia endophytica]TQL78206.1 helix-turn-helix protein [Stackebrandtia endophytica]
MTDHVATERNAPKAPRPLLRDTLGQVFRRARLSQGRTLADVARAARVSMPYLSELERGRKEASSEVIAAICEALGIELSDVLLKVGQLLVAERVHHARLARTEALRAASTRTPDAYCLAA